MAYTLSFTFIVVICVMASTSYGGYGTNHFEDIIYPTVMSVLMSRLPDLPYPESTTSLIIGNGGIIIHNDTEITCKTPLAVENSLLDELNQNYPAGTTITFNCSKNTHLVGEYNVTCLETGYWDKEWPTCERDPVTCRSPPEYLNMELVSTDAALNEYTEGYILHYQCDADFEMKSKGRIHCSENGWDGEKPVCDYVRCSKEKLPKIPNAIVKYVDHIIEYEYVVDTKVHYQCKDNYAWNLDYITKIYIVECLPRGIWRDPGHLSCNPEYCPNPGNIKNGQLRESSVSKYKVDSSAYLGCNDGFKLKGEAKIDCRKDGTWSQLPECFPVCSKPKIPFGEISTNYKKNGKDFQIGDWYTYSCDYVDSDVIHDKIKCITGPGGTAIWERETPNCKVDTCSLLGTIENGYGFKSKAKHSGQNIIVYGEKYEFDCNDKRKFKLQGTAEFTCIHGKWNHDELPKCVPIFCDEPPMTEHGMISGKKMTKGKFTPGDWVKISCSSKYNAHNLGEKKITCGIDGKWDSLPPECKQIKCPAPSNTLCITDKKNIYQPEDSITFYALSGFRIDGSPVTKCLYSGEWDRPIPICSEITCSMPHASNCHIATNHKQKYKIGESVDFRANGGYKIIGNHKATCTMDGDWKDLPECKQLERCTIPYIRELASSNCPKYITEGQTVKCVCGLWANHKYHGKYTFSCAAGAGGNPNKDGNCFWSCFKDDTQILEISKNQLKNLKDFKVGEKVNAIDPNSHQVIESKVTSVQCNDKESQFFEIELEANGYKINGITEDHFMNIVQNSGKIYEVPAKNVKQHDIVYILTEGGLYKSAIKNIKAINGKGYCNIETEHGNLFIGKAGINVSTESQSSDN